MSSYLPDSVKLPPAVQGDMGWLLWILRGMIYSIFAATYVAGCSAILLKIIRREDAHSEAVTPKAYLDRVLEPVHGSGNCLICWDTHQRPERILACGHTFCSNCIRAALANIDHCPFDMRPLSLPRRNTDVADQRYSTWRKSVRLKIVDNILVMLIAAMVAQVTDASGTIAGRDRETSDWLFSIGLMALLVLRGLAFVFVLAAIALSAPPLLSALRLIPEQTAVEIKASFARPVDLFSIPFAVGVAVIAPEVITWVSVWALCTVGVPLLLLYGANRCRMHHLFPR